MRVVLDTNVLARAIRGGANPACQVLEALLTRPHVLLASEFLLNELGRVLRYPRMKQMHGLDGASLDAFVLTVRSGSLTVDIQPDTPQVTTDTDDDPIVATAIEGKADVLCTWDRHFFAPTVMQHLAQFGIRVLRDTELLHELRQRD